MSSLKSFSLLLPMLVWSVFAIADHQPDAPWSWHVLSSGADESRLSVYRADELLGIYDLSCDLTDASEGERVEDKASLNLVQAESSSDGLLAIICNVGAHSQQITIINLTRNSKQAVYSVTGSYTAGWEIQDGELWIIYDEPCDTGPTVECPDGFVTKFVQYPGAAEDAANN